MKIGFSSRRFACIAFGDRVGGLRPDVDDRLVALGLGDETALVGCSTLPTRSSYSGGDFLLLGGSPMSVFESSRGLGRVLEPERLDGASHDRDGVGPVLVDQVGDERAELLFESVRLMYVCRPTSLPSRSRWPRQRAGRISALKITRARGRDEQLVAQRTRSCPAG